VHCQDAGHLALEEVGEDVIRSILEFFNWDQTTMHEFQLKPANAGQRRDSAFPALGTTGVGDCVRLKVRRVTKCLGAVVAAVGLIAGPVSAADRRAMDIQEVRALFLRQAAGATAKNIHEMDAVLARAAPGQQDTVSFVARAYRYWGREDVLAHFRTIFTGTWRFEPEETNIRVTLLGNNVAQIYAPTRVTSGAAGQAAITSEFYMLEMAVRTPQGWRISSIIAVPAR
jgi:hypothetical protein